MWLKLKSTGSAALPTRWCRNNFSADELLQGPGAPALTCLQLVTSPRISRRNFLKSASMISATAVTSLGGAISPRGKPDQNMPHPASSSSSSGAPLTSWLLPRLTTGDETLDRAWLIALGDLAGNIQLHKGGMLESPAPCLIAGLDYRSPWTRDAAFNTWYGAGLLFPEVARNTLSAVLEHAADGSVQLEPHQYWDAIIWAHGAWQYFIYSGDQEFLQLAQPLVARSLRFFEENEFDPADGLFRGGACFQDGVAGYPDYYAPQGTPFSGIADWVKHAGSRRAPQGGGIPCKALSTNCLYYRAYEVAAKMTQVVGLSPDPAWEEKRENLRRAINTHFWSESLGRYRYLVDAPGIDDRQEGLGLAFALLFGVADDRQAERILDSVYLAPRGMPCVWPTYERYAQRGGLGRHSGPIWPQVNTAWALACAARGRPQLALNELRHLAESAVRNGEFIEVLHPETGEPYGGLQENSHTGVIEPYPIIHRQSWCASGYLAMTLACLFGVQIDEHGLTQRPGNVAGLKRAQLSGLRFRGTLLDLHAPV
jgi:glycogen debranching enzyme